MSYFNQSTIAGWNGYTKAIKQLIDNTSYYPQNTYQFSMVSKVEDDAEEEKTFSSVI